MINHKINRNKKGNILSYSLITPTPVGCGHHKVCFFIFFHVISQRFPPDIIKWLEVGNSKQTILKIVQTLVLLSFEECPGRNYFLKGEWWNLTYIGEITFFLGHYNSIRNTWRLCAPHLSPSRQYSLCSFVLSWWINRPFFQREFS